jgi:peptidoglycan hydrolase-like protein with peptidoglycan-binding domain
MFSISRSSRSRIVFASLVMGLLVLSLALRASATGSSDGVKKVQQTLTDKGYNPGTVDGAMGPRTRAAIGKYQQDQGLKVTHHIDSDTADKLGVPQESVGNTFKSAGHDVAKGGKDFGHEIKKGDPVEAGKDLGKGVGEGGKKTGEGVQKTVTNQ